MAPSDEQDQQAEGAALPVAPPPITANAAIQQAADQLVATGTVERLDLDTVDTGRVDEAMGWAKVVALHADTAARILMVLVMAGLFVWLNFRVLQVVERAFAADLRMLEAKPPGIAAGDRLVTANVLMSLIGATVVQVGISIAAVVSYLFPKANGKPE
jgi:hypothetical protein